MPDSVHTESVLPIHTQHGCRIASVCVPWLALGAVGHNTPTDMPLPAKDDTNRFCNKSNLQRIYGWRGQPAGGRGGAPAIWADLACVAVSHLHTAKEFIRCSKL